MTQKFEYFRSYSRHIENAVDERIALTKGLCNPSHLGKFTTNLGWTLVSDGVTAMKLIWVILTHGQIHRGLLFGSINRDRPWLVVRRRMMTFIAVLFYPKRCATSAVSKLLLEWNNLNYLIFHEIINLYRRQTSINAFNKLVFITFLRCIVRYVSKTSLQCEPAVPVAGAASAIQQFVIWVGRIESWMGS